LLVSTGAVSCYPALMVNLFWFADEIFFHVSTKQHGGLKSDVSRARNSTISQFVCAGVLFCWKLQSAAKVKLSPQMRKNDCWLFWGISVAAMIKLQ